MATVLFTSGLLLSAAGGMQAQAGVWSGSARTGGNVGYDDNVLLSIRDPIASPTWGAELGASLQLSDANYSLSFDPRLVAMRYRDYDLYDRNEQYASLSGRWLGERSRLDVRLDGVSNTTLTSELGLTGYTQNNKRHRSVSLTASPTWLLSQRVSLGAQLYATTHHYSDAQNTGLLDYDYGLGALTAGYDWSERSHLTLQASLGKLRVPDVDGRDKTSLSVTLNHRYQWTERWESVLSVGPSRIQTQSRDDNGTVYEASVSRKSETGNVRLAATRDVTPTGQGNLTRRDQFSLQFAQPLSERTTFSLGANWIHNREVLPDGDSEGSATRYADLSVALRWAITPTWSLSLSAGHTRQTYDNVEGQARRNHAALNISWNGQQHVF